MKIPQATLEKLLSEKLLVDSPTAAGILSISKRSLFSLQASGEIPFVRIGRSVRFDIRDLVAFIDRQKKGGAA